MRPRGYKCSTETKAKIGAANKRIFEELTEEQKVERRKRSATSLHVWRAKNGGRLPAEQRTKIVTALREYAKNETVEAKNSRIDKARKSLLRHLKTHSNSMSGRRHSEETKRKMSAARKSWLSSLTEEEYRAYFDKAHEAAGKYNRNTKPERIFAEIAKRNNFPFERQVSVAGHRWDFRINGNHLVDIDGCYWHSCPQCFPDGSGREQARFRDAEVTQAAIELGFMVSRFWECQLKESASLLPE